MQIKIRFGELKNRFGYTVHYSVLEANTICNIYGPDSGVGIGWDNLPRRHKKANRIITKRNKVDNFFTKLEESILEKGLLNPIMIYAGSSAKIKVRDLPDYMQYNPANILICVHGCSRLYYAQKYNMSVSCIICSWGSKVKKDRMIRSESDLINCYKTPPKFMITATGLRILELNHIHMKEK